MRSYENNAQGWVEFGFDTGASVASKYWLFGTYLSAREWPCHTIQHDWIAINYTSANPLGEFGRPLMVANESEDYGVYDSQPLFDWIATEQPGGDLMGGQPFYPLIDGFGHYAVSYTSHVPGKPVHAIADGTVQSVDLLQWDDCLSRSFIYWDSIGSQGAELTVSNVDDGGLENSAITCSAQLFLPESEQSEMYNRYQEMYLDVEDVYLVTISYSEDIDLIYVVKNATEYLSPGQSITQGCVIGQTTALLDEPWGTPEWLSDLVNYLAVDVTNRIPLIGAFLSNFIKERIPYETAVGIGMVSAQDNGEEIALIDSLVNYPLDDEACYINPIYEACETEDPDLQHDYQYWSSSPYQSVTWLHPGAGLGANESIYQTLLLDSETAYSLNVQAKPESGVGEGMTLTLQLGTTQQSFDMIGEWNSYTIDSAIHAPDVGTFYTALVKNTSDSPIIVKSICVSPGEPNLAPGSCYFSNNSFDYGFSDWDTSGTVHDLGDGSIVLEYGSTMSQNAKLSTGDYTVTINFEAYFDPDQTPNESLTYQPQYEYPASSGFVDIPGAAITNGGTYVAFRSINVASDEDSTFTLSPNITSGNNTFVGVRIFDVCLEGDWDWPDGTGTSIETTCEVISWPQGSDIGDWIFYLWRQLDRFFQCDLMIILKNIWKEVNEFRTTVAWTIRYQMSSAIQFTSWLETDLLPWLNGHFYNMAVGQTTYITGDQECNNIFCFFTMLFGTGGSIFHDLTTTLQVLFTSLADTINNLINSLTYVIGLVISQIIGPVLDTLLGIHNQVVLVLLTIIIAIVQIGMMVIGQIFGLFNYMLHIGEVIINAWNTATPTAVPGLPTCAIDPKSNAFCAGLWMLENTIFSGPGQLLIPILIGYGSIMMLLWAIGELKSVFVEAGQAL